MDSARHRPQTGAMSAERRSRSGELRPPGLLVIAGIVVLGLGSGAAYFHYQEPRLKADLERQIAESPKTAEGRLAIWHLHGGPQIHHRLTNFGRWSNELPWLITHAVQVPDGGLSLWGIDCTSIAPGALTRVEGMHVVVELPAPGPLGVRWLTQAELRFVPVYAREADVPDPAARLEFLCRSLLGGIPAALEKDIRGASLEFRVASPEAG